MNRLQIVHSTLYQYRRPVRFGEHRLMIRPRDSHDMRLVTSGLKISPPGTIRWQHDVFSNSVAVVTFTELASELRFESSIEIELFPSDDLQFPVDETARNLPFVYPSEELPDVTRLAERHYPDPDSRVDNWVRQFLDWNGRGNTMDVLRNITSSIPAQFRYEGRIDEGTRSPAETLSLGVGSCRDFAVLMMEAARALGLAARFVTGYLYDPSTDQGAAAVKGAGAPHAWLQVYVPGAGWIEMDPTNGIIGGRDLVRVAVARDPSQAVPVRGTYFGSGDDFLSLDVAVRVEAVY